jgi:methylase of polypeptide subunit release factors
LASPAIRAYDTEAALTALLQELKLRGYNFVCPTPDTHRRVIAQPGRERAETLRDVLGWSLPFAAGVLDDTLHDLLERGGVLQADGGLLRSSVRVSSLGEDLYLHSAYPTTDEDAVFFGPDSYRFARLIETELRARQEPSRTVVDIGTGAGVGAIAAARLTPGAALFGTDINPKALRLAAINAAAAGVPLEPRLGETLDPIDGPIDIALANPPYIVDRKGREYRDGGAQDGGEVSLEMSRQALPRLAPGGTFILYTGATIVDGRDALRERLAALAQEHGCTLRYREIDPDVFGEELSNPEYRGAERIAAVAVVFDRPL